MSSFSHIDDQGRARMVDISGKPRLHRTAIAEGHLYLQPRTVELIRRQSLPKGDPFEVARVAAIQAAKRTSGLIPLCHDLQLDFADVEIELLDDSWRIRSQVSCHRATGVEMEALTAVSVAALTLYDMCKAVDKQMRIGEIRLIEKRKETPGQDQSST
ncbi:MAG TPA: cyclic pyranopterin monophosphate synthase MoaC [Acidobacteriota bacterium]|nr:cyclic pyranopterin monophosphate synthase MoaC [Acidobacteriota bacterium]